MSLIKTDPIKAIFQLNLNKNVKICQNTVKMVPSQFVLLKDRQQSLRPVLVRSQYTED